MTDTITPIILAGGSGTRLWPLSTGKCPKQLLPLLGKRSLLQNTLERISGIKNIAAPLLICNQQHRFKITEQLQEINLKPSAIILEPMGRNTAPAISIAALQAMADGQDPLLLVLPSDHIISDIDAFYTTIATAKQHAEFGKLVTFGVVPTHPSTGFGYIKAGESLQVQEFVEKPNLEKAQEYLAAGNYYWNSGMFMFRASRLLKEMEQYAPDILQACKDTFATHVINNDYIHLNEAEFSQCPSNSIDYAVMEKTANAAVIPLDAKWSDIGSWLSLWEHSEKDVNNNVTIGDVVAEDVTGSYIHATRRKVIAIGIKDIVMVENEEGILLVHKDNCQELKKLI
jgi:mannose-1-phosphate guanylyltransferase/mannose-6-phosphate isomerase